MHEYFFATKKFTIRPFRASDAIAVRKNIQDKVIFDNTLKIPRPYLLKHAKEHIAKNLKQYRMNNPANIGFVIDVGGEAVGAIGFTFRGRTGEIGYWLAKRHRRKGIVSLVVGHIVDYLFHTYKIEAIQASVYVQNEASRGVLLKNGFKKIGDEMTVKNGEDRPVERFEIRRPN